MNLRKIFTIIFICSPWLLCAQINHVINGKVTDANGNTVQSAMVVLQKQSDSTVIASELTDASGAYSLTTNNATVFIKAEMLGYNPVYNNIDPAKKVQVVNITLKETSKTLSEITITSHKPVVEYKADRTIFNVENSITASGGDAWDALKKTPGVLVLRNQVTIAGRNSVGVMLNGRLQQLSDEELAQLLRTIPADNLSKIEVITNPPARYDAEGNGGLINIVTKRTMKSGLKGNVTASYNRNHNDAPSLSTTLNYRMPKLYAFGSANINKFAWKYTSWANTYYPDQHWYQDITLGSVTANARIQGGIEYNITRNSILGFQYSEAGSKERNLEDISVTGYNNAEVIDSTIRTIGETNERMYGKRNANINYEWKIDSSGKKMNIDLDYYVQHTERIRDFNVFTELDNGTIYNATVNKMIATPSTEIKSGKIDMEWPLKFARFSFGGKWSKVATQSDNVYKTQDGNGEFLLDTMKTSAFSYNEEIQAVYLSALKTIGKYEIQAGIRTEHTQTNGYSSTIGQTNVNDYIKFFPSGYIQYSPSENHSFSLSVARRINRPWYGALNPFRFYYSPMSYREGNPSLRPSFSTRGEFAYVYKSNYRFNVIVNHTDNYWDRIINTDTVNSTSSITWANLGNTNFMSAGINATFTPVKWLECSVELNGAYAYFKPFDKTAAPSYHAFNGWLESQNIFQLNKKHTLAFELSGLYYTPRQKDYKRWDVIWCVNLGLRWTSPDKKWIMTLNGDDIFATAYWLQTNLKNSTKEYSYDDERSVRISATYKFGNKNIKGRRDRNTIEEIQRANQ